MLPAFATAFQGALRGGTAAPNVADVFKVALYTGNGSTQTIDTTIAPDLTFLKCRSNGTTYGGMYDRVRGAGKVLLPALDWAETVTTPNDNLYAFTGSGFSVGADATHTVNTGSRTYLSLNFKEAARFFDIVTWTGNGANRTIAHALGVAPGLIMVKRLDSAGDWRLWHRSLTSSAYGITFVATEASEPTLWNSTPPDASSFALGTHNDVNANGATYVAYLWAHDTAADGIIQCGTFTTDGSNGATVSGLPFQPQFAVFAYRTGGTPYWTILDTTRAWGAGSDPRVFWGSTDAEAVFDHGAPTSDGFTITNFIANTPTLYMAIKAP